MHLPRARHEYLLREVELRGNVRSADAAVHLGVSEVTIRRDIVDLAQQVLVPCSRQVHRRLRPRDPCRGSTVAIPISGDRYCLVERHRPPPSSTIPG
jgi:predicted ArsR family transcriptional regulator